MKKTINTILLVLIVTVAHSQYYYGIEFGYTIAREYNYKYHKENLLYNKNINMFSGYQYDITKSQTDKLHIVTESNLGYSGTIYSQTCVGIKYLKSQILLGVHTDILFPLDISNSFYSTFTIKAKQYFYRNFAFGASYNTNKSLTITLYGGTFFN